MSIYDPLNDGVSKLELIDSMGNDLSIVNDAKASFERYSEDLGVSEKKLIISLLTSYPQHTSPLRGVTLKFKVKAPLGIARQWYKHVVASSHIDDQLQWNERSFRYSEALDPNEFYIPSEFRTQSTRNKQSSADPLDFSRNTAAYSVLRTHCDESFKTYKTLISYGVCREQARLALNPAIYTSWIWTTSLQAVLHFCSLRFHKDAQVEICKYAESIRKCIQQVAPFTYLVYTEVENELNKVVPVALQLAKSNLIGNL